MPRWACTNWLEHHFRGAEGPVHAGTFLHITNLTSRPARATVNYWDEWGRLVFGWPAFINPHDTIQLPRPLLSAELEDSGIDNGWLEIIADRAVAPFGYVFHETRLSQANPISARRLRFHRMPEGAEALLRPLATDWFGYWKVTQHAAVVRDFDSVTRTEISILNPSHVRPVTLDYHAYWYTGTTGTHLDSEIGSATLTPGERWIMAWDPRDYPTTSGWIRFHGSRGILVDGEILRVIYREAGIRSPPPLPMPVRFGTQARARHSIEFVPAGETGVIGRLLAPFERFGSLFRSTPPLPDPDIKPLQRSRRHSRD